MTVTGQLSPTPPPTLRPAPAAPGLDARAGRAVDWLQRSGIQHRSGGHHGWFDRQTGRYPFLYAEVTGYQVTFAAWLARTEPGPRTHLALAGADRAVHWLAERMQAAPGAFRCLVAPPARALPPRLAEKATRCYTFDAGIILQGLVAHSVATGSRLALRTARATGERLLAQLGADGTLPPWPARHGGPWPEAAADWSTRPGVHHAKTGIGLAALGDLTGDERFTAAATAVCRSALAFQQDDGRFVTNPQTGGTNLHPHCYAAEALWAVGTATGDDALREAAARATSWALDAVDADGLPPRRWTPGSPPVRHPRVDALAQVLRLAALHGQAAGAAAGRVAAALLHHQVHAPGEPRAHGGFVFGSSSSGQPLPHANVWVTAFAVQALTLSGQVGPAHLDWRHLV